MPAINPLPTPPSRNDPANFSDRADAFLAALPAYTNEANALLDDVHTSRDTVQGLRDEVMAAGLASAATNAATATTKAAEASASAAEAFGYLQAYRATSYGALASDPVVDPNGNPPTVGDEYFNTTMNLLKRFNGVAWQASDIATANLAAPGGSALVGYQQAGSGSVPRTVADELRDRVSVKQFGVIGDGSDEYTKIKAAWDYCLANGKDLYFPAGIYSSGINSMPMGRVNGLPPTSLLDCKNITIFGDGPTTILRSDSVNGADVLQLNGAKNLHIRNLAVKAAISGATAGSNGVSVTGGYDNITLENVWAEDLPSVDKTTYVDGGKALSIQTPVAGQTVPCGKLKATNIYAKGCAHGFGLELDLVAASTMPTSIEVEIVAENCRDAVIVSAGEATAAIPANWTMGVKVRAQAINCMVDVVLARAHGVDVECQVITTKTGAERILNPQGVKWKASDTAASVEGLICTYAHNSAVSIYGNKGACSYKARVGGNSSGSSGLTGATWKSHITVALSGTASVADFGGVDSGGLMTTECTLISSGKTAAPDIGHYLPARNNAIVVGNAQMLKDLLVQNAVKFSYSDGQTSYAEINYDNESVTVQQTLGSTASLRPLKVLNSAGVGVFAVRNDGAFATSGRGSATAVATVKGVLPVYTEANVLFGYVPVYTTYTP